MSIDQMRGSLGLRSGSELPYPEAIQFLYSLHFFGAKFGLENTLELAAHVGNPHRQLRFIHVAGTNGKGSTCAMLESIYRAAGLRVGLFTSPHLVSFRERLQVNRELISMEDVARLVTDAQCLLARPSVVMRPTFFEVLTVVALRYFLEQRCDLVIWETGLGGRLDATNIVTPLASVITNIQLDHEKWLGSSLPEIAAEKAGIIKPGVPVITATDEPEALKVIMEAAGRNRSTMSRVTWDDVNQPPLNAVQLPMLGDHQRKNAALAVATVDSLNSRIPVSSESLRAGLEGVRWPGRMQRFVTSDGRSILLDGAHNPAGAESLRRAMESHFPGQTLTLILGILRDKDYASMCRILAPLAKRILLSPVHSERSASSAELQRVCAEIAPDREAIACDSLSEALERSERDAFVVIAGSLHFVGEAMELLQILPSSAEERGLNEWDAAGRGAGVSAALP